MDEIGRWMETLHRTEHPQDSSVLSPLAQKCTKRHRHLHISVVKTDFSLHTQNTITLDTQTSFPFIIHNRSSPPSCSVCLRERLTLENHSSNYLQSLMINVYIANDCDVLVWDIFLPLSFDFKISHSLCPLYFRIYHSLSLSLFLDKSLSPPLLFTVFISEYVTTRILFHYTLLLIL